MKEYKGILHGHFETGCEGTQPALMEFEHISEDGKSWSYHGLQCIEPGDHLTIYKNDEEVFSGKIKAVLSNDKDRDVVLIDEKDMVAKWEAYPGNPKLGQLHINGYWVHWLPTNVDLRLWWDVFFMSRGEYIGLLKKK